MSASALTALLAAGFFVAVLLVRAASRNRLVRRKLVLSLLLLAASAVMSALLPWNLVSEELTGRAQAVNQLVLALALINLAVVLAVNPLRHDRVPERFPTIVQDTIIIVLFALVATSVLGEKFLTTSAVGAVVVGFALQDTLGNMFAGLAIQVEKPFRVGHWVSVGSFEGKVTEVTWRATKLRTKAGNQVILPNALVSKEAIVNYSEPEIPTRLDVVVGVSYDVPPDQVRAALREAVENAPLALREPAPDVTVDDFSASAVTYRVRFWIGDFEQDVLARDQVRSAIYYALKRHRFEIPFPMQVEFLREERHERAADRIDRADQWLARVDLFAPLSAEERRELAAQTVENVYGAGEALVRQDAQGDSMFVIGTGHARVVEASGHEVASIGPGGYVGEMSMLTGQPRSATVLAAGECVVLELTARALRDVALVNPHVLQSIGRVVADRRADLERKRADAAKSMFETEDASRSLLDRIQNFLGLPGLFRT
jgi:small-conductance mechanosensitive channel/CRP-like cAMP-binding protein